jgi:glyoxylase-like metal-dependent hydrolase (beta-lactamase superfamily II)
MDLPHPMCLTCGVQYERGADPGRCPICEDDRQYVPPAGQRWTSVDRLTADGFRNRFAPEAYDLVGIGTEPKFAIGQRALLVPGSGGNLLWDCISLIDDETVRAVTDLGGVAAVAISHPHYYGSMISFSEAFGGAPVFIHERDRQWVQRAGNVEFWSGDTVEALPGRTLHRAGIHFDGGTILHWPAGADGRGALLTGDIFQVVADRNWLSFMYSYPNYIPEHPATIRRAVELVDSLDFAVIYGAFWDKVVTRDAKRAVARSARRYFEHIGLEF